MIVKDEEKDIERCLLSIYEHVDEIVIVDTGSTDGTLMLLEDFYADKFLNDRFFCVHEIPWNGSFADMRNHSMDLATCEAILIIDADEYIEDGWDYIKEALEHPHFIAGSLNVVNSTASGPVRGERLFQTRIVRNTPYIRWEYKIHNQIDHNIKKYTKRYFRKHGKRGVICGINATLIHTGYSLSKDGMIDKYTKRAEMCRSAIADAMKSGKVRDEHYYRFQLALFLTVMGEDEETLELWEEVDFEHLNRYNRWYGHYVASRSLLKQGHLHSAMRHCSQMFYTMWGDINDGPIAEEAAAWMITGVVLLGLGERDWGIVYLLEAWLKNLTPQMHTRVVLNNNVIINDVRDQYEEGSEERFMLAARDIPVMIENVRKLQRLHMPFDHTLLELVDNEFTG